VVEKLQTDSEDAEITELRVEELARDLAEKINSVPNEQREQLREMVVHLVRDEVRIAPSPSPRSTGSGGRADSFNPFALGIPLLLAGGVLSILFPPVGLLLFAAAGMSMAWGVLSVFLSRGGN
jgi:hypothetical protein